MSLFNELKRRNVFRMTIGYVVSSWLLVQVADLVLENIGAPDWVIQTIMLVIALGFPVVVFFSWAYEVTPGGIKRESEVDRSQSISHVTGRKLDYSILAVLVLALGYFIWESRFSGSLPKGTDKPLLETVAENEAAIPAGPTIESTLPDTLSIAILPFDNRSNREEDQFFADGIHDDLLTTIAKIRSMQVISRTSVMAYKGTTKKLPQIAQELGVANILEGGIQRSGDQVRINVQLIDAQTDRHVWAENYDRKLTAENLFAIQSEIAEAVAEALSVALSDDENRRLRITPTTSLEAYGEYVLGRQAQVNRIPADLERAREHFEKAVELDPDYALAWLGIADSLDLFAQYTLWDSSEFFAQRQQAIDRAFALAPDAGETLVSLAALQRDQGLPAEAEVSYRRAIELNPSNDRAHHWLAVELRNHGRNEEALDYIRNAIRLNPTEPVLISAQATILQKLGRFDEAEKTARTLIQQFPDFPAAYSTMVEILTARGDLAEAARWADTMAKSGVAGPQGVFRCMLFLDLADEEVAERCFDALVEANPNAIVFRAVLHAYRQQWPEYAAMGQYFVNLPGLAYVAGDAYSANGEIDKAGAVMRKVYPQYFDGSEVLPNADYNELAGLVVSAAVLWKEGDAERADYLTDRALEVLEAVTGTPGAFVVKQDLEIAIRVFKSDHEGAVAALRAAINAGWRSGWWRLKRPFYDEMLQEPEWVTLMTELEADIARQRLWYEDHKNDPLF